MKLIRILILAITYGACAQEEPSAIVVQATPGSPPTTAPQAVSEAPPEQIEDRCAGVRAESIQLRLLVAELQAKVIAAQEETARYRDGLDRAVGELNRLQGAALTDGARAPAPRPTYQEPPARPRVSIYSPPQVQIVGESILVTGRMYNHGDAQAVGTITVELLVDGRRVDIATDNLQVPPNNAMSFAHTFHRSPQEGTYSARVTPNY